VLPRPSSKGGQRGLCPAAEPNGESGVILSRRESSTRGPRKTQQAIQRSPFNPSQWLGFLFWPTRRAAARRFGSLFEAAERFLLVAITPWQPGAAFFLHPTPACRGKRRKARQCLRRTFPQGARRAPIFLPRLQADGRLGQWPRCSRQPDTPPCRERATGSVNGPVRPCGCAAPGRRAGAKWAPSA
jgi:hypothetical protein